MRLAQAAVVAAFVLVVAACGEGAASVAPSAEGPTTPAEVGALGPGCELLTDAEIAQAAGGITIEERTEGASTETLSTCKFRGSTPDGATVVLTVSAWDSGGAAKLEQERGKLATSLGTLEPYEGLGDAASWGRGGALWVLVGDRLGFIDISTGGVPQRQLAESLMKVLVPKLGA